MADDEFTGVPASDWLDTLRAVSRAELMAAIAVFLISLTLLALLRKGVLSAADLYPLATR